MIKNYTKKYFLPILITLFFLDICSFAAFNYTLFHFVLCAYILIVFQTRSIFVLGSAWLLLGLESTLYFGIFGLDLIYAIPAYYAGILMQEVLYRKTLQPYILLIICLVIRHLIVSLVGTTLCNPLIYTLWAIFANIIVIWLMTFIQPIPSKMALK